MIFLSLKGLTGEPILNKQILAALIEHAQHIAKLTLESKDSGKDLVKDVKVNFFLKLNRNLKIFQVLEMIVLKFTI